MNSEKNRFNVEEHTTLDGKIIDVFPVSHRYIHELEQQVKKQKEVIDRILNETKATKDILNNNRDNNMLSKSCLLSYLEIVEDILKEVPDE